MGKPDLFAKRTFASQTAKVTRGAVSWKDAPEMGLEHVQSDGILVVHNPLRLQELAAPWRLVKEIEEILLEFKLQGDHVDRTEACRTLVRRQVRELQRLEEANTRKTPWLGRQTLWLASGYIPEWAQRHYRLDEHVPGCYRFLREDFTALWIASNELPLCDELVPFLITRTGRHLREFLEWVAPRTPLTWVQDLVISLRMIPKDFLKDVYPTLDEEGKRNIESWIYGFLEDYPSIRRDITEQDAKKAATKAAEKAALSEAREAVKQNLRARKFAVCPEHLARIDACRNLDSLHRWHVRAVTAASVEEALAED